MEWRERVAELVYIGRFVVAYGAREGAASMHPETYSTSLLSVLLFCPTPRYSHHLLRVSYDVLVGSMEDSLAV